MPRVFRPTRCTNGCAVRDIQDAADILLPVYERTGKRDGYVSLEVSPKLAHHTARDHRGSTTAREGRRPAKPDDQGARNVVGVAGHPAAFIAAGVNVNATLLFSHVTYEKVIDLYLLGLRTACRERSAAGRRRQRRELLHQPARLRRSTRFITGALEHGARAVCIARCC